MSSVQKEESFVFLPQVVANYITKYLIAVSYCSHSGDAHDL